jgi:hypothetical protein
MTIKVCKQKFERRSSTFAIISLITTQLITTGLIGWFVLEIAGIVDYSHVLGKGYDAFSFIMFVVLVTTLSHLFSFVFGVHWIQWLVRKQNLFEWNRDC